MTPSSSGAGSEPRISFEFFPPKTPSSTMALWRAVERLAPLGPDFVSVTYGAGGTTRDRTLAAILAIRDRARLDVAGHLTCVGASKTQVLDVAKSYAKLGCRSIVALRGDAPDQSKGWEAHPDGFAGVDGIFRFLPNGLNERGLAVLEMGRNGPQVVDPAPVSFVPVPTF